MACKKILCVQDGTTSQDMFGSVHVHVVELAVVTIFNIISLCTLFATMRGNL